MATRVMLLMALAAVLASAHPMGNFSVNHYARIEPVRGGLRIRYVLDLAEIPTFELSQQWGEGADPKAKVRGQAEAWARALDLRVDGTPVDAKVERAEIVLADGAGDMKVARIEAELFVEAAGGTFVYEDRNYQGRAGWKEIVLPGQQERSAALTAYPQDPMIAPPQDVRVTFSWKGEAPAVRTEPVLAKTEPAPVAPMPVAPSAPGTVTRGDYLSQLLHRGDIGWGLALVGMVVAFGLGALHAMSPGHGKTIVAAYLVGSRGTFRHAALLGAVVTFTHTASVFLLGFVTLFLSRFILPDRLMPWLGAISGISIVWVGGTLFVQRLRARKLKPHTHAMPEGEITMGSLITLGASGGLVPCPSALVLLLSSISLGRIALGIVLLMGFSLGLAAVLMLMGILALYARSLMPASKKLTSSPAFALLPVASAAFITCVGIVMTVVSLV